MISWGSSRQAARQNCGRDLLSATDQNELALDQLARVAAAAAAVAASPVAIPRAPTPEALGLPLVCPLVLAWPHPEFVSCCGISEKTIADSNVANKTTLLPGFWHLYGNACRFKASFRSKNISRWEYDANVEGFIMDLRNETDDLDNYSWMCIQHDGKGAWTQHGYQKTTSNNNCCCNTCWNAV